jgi:hypothetical protein
MDMVKRKTKPLNEQVRITRMELRILGLHLAVSQGQTE